MPPKKTEATTPQQEMVSALKRSRSQEKTEAQTADTSTPAQLHAAAAATTRNLWLPAVETSADPAQAGPTTAPSPTPAGKTSVTPAAASNHHAPTPDQENLIQVLLHITPTATKAQAAYLQDVLFGLLPGSRPPVPMKSIEGVSDYELSEAPYQLLRNPQFENSRHKDLFESLLNESKERIVTAAFQKRMMEAQAAQPPASKARTETPPSEGAATPPTPPSPALVASTHVPLGSKGLSLTPASAKVDESRRAMAERSLLINQGGSTATITPVAPRGRPPTKLIAAAAPSPNVKLPTVVPQVSQQSMGQLQAAQVAIDVSSLAETLALPNDSRVNLHDVTVHEQNLNPTPYGAVTVFSCTFNQTGEYFDLNAWRSAPQVLLSAKPVVITIISNVKARFVASLNTVVFSVQSGTQAAVAAAAAAASTAGSLGHGAPPPPPPPPAAGTVA